METRSTPFITIGIPTYNRPEGLARTLRNATGQTYRHLEILISDNASANVEAVKNVVKLYEGDSRVRYFRQDQNIGSLGNFQFLLGQAQGDYFLWMSDDDEVELQYIERLVDKLVANPKAAIVMGGYDIEDKMAEPVIKLNLTQHLLGLSGNTAFERMKSYIQQPDHLGKSRLNWGMFPTHLIRRSFAECRSNLPGDAAPIWADFPIDLRMLSYGNLAVVEEVLWHVKLLPTSDGKSTLAGSFAKMANISRHTEISMAAAVRDAHLTPEQTAELVSMLRSKARKEKIQLFVYYNIVSKWPWLARKVKKLWYLLFS